MKAQLMEAIRVWRELNQLRASDEMMELNLFFFNLAREGACADVIKACRLRGGELQEQLNRLENRFIELTAGVDVTATDFPEQLKSAFEALGEAEHDA